MAIHCRSDAGRFHVLFPQAWHSSHRKDEESRVKHSKSKHLSLKESAVIAKAKAKTTTSKHIPHRGRGRFHQLDRGNFDPGGGGLAVVAIEAVMKFHFPLYSCLGGGASSEATMAHIAQLGDWCHLAFGSESVTSKQRTSAV
jgi:hypothetical protein